MLAHIQDVAQLVQHARQTYVDAGRIPESDIPPVIDKRLSEEELCSKLRGSLLRTTTASGTVKIYAIPAIGAVYSRDGPKLQVIDKWGAAAVEKAVSKHQAWHD